MFSDDLKQLIEAAVTDCKVTAKEMKVIARRAEAEGVDMDELEIYIDSRIQQRNMEGSEMTQVVNRMFDYFEKAKKIKAEERTLRRKQKAEEKAALREFRAAHPDDFEHTLNTFANTGINIVSTFMSGKMEIGKAANIAKSLFDVIKPKK